jgi:hypothetical protein
VLFRSLIQWGRIGFVTIRDKYVKKLDNRAQKCVFVGYAEDHSDHTYRFFNPKTQKVILSHDVTWADWHGLSSATHDLTKVYQEAATQLKERITVKEVDDIQQPNEEPIASTPNDDDDEHIPAGPSAEPHQFPDDEDDASEPPPLKYTSAADDDEPPPLIPPIPTVRRMNPGAGRTTCQQGATGSGRSEASTNPKVA